LKIASVLDSWQIFLKKQHGRKWLFALSYSL
jgi:hypothetical protein